MNNHKSYKNSTLIHIESIISIDTTIDIFDNEKIENNVLEIISDDAYYLMYAIIEGCYIENGRNKY